MSLYILRRPWENYPHSRVDDYSFINSYTEEELIIVKAHTPSDDEPYCLYSTTKGSFVFNDLPCYNNEPGYRTVRFSTLIEALEYLEVWVVTPG